MKIGDVVSFSFGEFIPIGIGYTHFTVKIGVVVEIDSKFVKILYNIKSQNRCFVTINLTDCTLVKNNKLVHETLLRLSKNHVE